MSGKFDGFVSFRFRICNGIYNRIIVRLQRKVQGSLPPLLLIGALRLVMWIEYFYKPSLQLFVVVVKLELCCLVTVTAALPAPS